MRRLRECSSPAAAAPAKISILHLGFQPKIVATAEIFRPCHRFSTHNSTVSYHLNMGTGKKEATRRERQGKTGDGMANVRTKGENFYRSAKKVKTLNMFKEGKAIRNASGDVVKAASFQSRDKPSARIEPHRKWFTNTRVISQDALNAFRGAVEAQSKDPYSFLLKQNKLPMSLIHDNKDKERKDGLIQHQAKIKIETEKFGDTFGPKAQRKRPRLAVSSLEDFASATTQDFSAYEEKLEEARLLSGMGQAEHEASTDPRNADGQSATAREPVFSKGQSKRIWNELYKVIDSSDVIVHVLDARDPLGTRCRSVEKYIRDEAPHKHLLFLLNKCDLVPTSIAVRIHCSRCYPPSATCSVRLGQCDRPGDRHATALVKVRSRLFRHSVEQTCYSAGRSSEPR
jgi:nuclear GTP-binding protein